MKMMYRLNSWPPGLSKVLGAAEQRIELYIQYSEGAAQAATTQFAKSTGGATSWTGWQAGAARRL